MLFRNCFSVFVLVQVWRHTKGLSANEPFFSSIELSLTSIFTLSTSFLDHVRLFFYWEIKGTKSFLLMSEFYFYHSSIFFSSNFHVTIGGSVFCFKKHVAESKARNYLHSKRRSNELPVHVSGSVSNPCFKIEWQNTLNLHNLPLSKASSSLALLKTWNGCQLVKMEF